MQENFSFPAGGEVFSLDIPFYRTPRGNGEHPIDRTYGHGAIPRPYQVSPPRRILPRAKVHTWVGNAGCRYSNTTTSTAALSECRFYLFRLWPVFSSMRNHVHTMEKLTSNTASTCTGLPARRDGSNRHCPTASIAAFARGH